MRNEAAGFRELVDQERAERGWSLQQLAAAAGFGSAQAVQQKLAGTVRLQPIDVLAIADALVIDVFVALEAAWPAIGDRDRLRRLRILLQDATPAEIEALEQIAERMAGQRAAVEADELSARRR